MTPEEMLRRIVEELRQSEPSVYAAGRALMSTAWNWLASNRTEGEPTLINPGRPNSLLNALWEPIAGPLAAGAVDELQAQIEALVAPKVKKMLFATGAAGIGVGFTVARLMGIGRSK